MNYDSHLGRIVEKEFHNKSVEDDKFNTSVVFTDSEFWAFVEKINSVIK